MAISNGTSASRALNSTQQNQPDLNWIANFIWGIADDVLRDVYVRGKYRDVILPMTVIRRLDAILEPTKPAVLKMQEQLTKARVTNQHAALCQASGQAFYNISPFTLRDLRSRAKQQVLKSDFEAYLHGFSSNVQEILEKFQFFKQIDKLIDADILSSLIEKFISPNVNLSPRPVLDTNGEVRLPGLDNHAMGTIFEELIRRFNEENNEEAGEHFTPRDVVKLMADLVFLPIADKIESGTYLVYDGACGTGGMLTVAQERLQQLADEHGKQVSIHLFGQEISPETYAITKADLLLQGEGSEAENMNYGSTLSQDGSRNKQFDFMLSNPPYGKSWKIDLEKMGGKEGIRDPRFIITHADDSEFSLLPRSSDGQLLFLVNMLSKMKQDTMLGSRIAEVHNGSSLFTGDAGQGESNVRRWIIENDWLEAIVALPLNIFYNTGIATYIWILTNRKPGHRRGKVQLIDATKWFQPLRKNLGKKNCELSPEHIQRIVQTFLDFKETEESKIFANEAFGYRKIRVERPLRLHSRFTRKAVEDLRFASGDEELRRRLFEEFGNVIYDDFAGTKPKMEGLLTTDKDSDDGEESGSDPTSSAVPEKRKKKLLKQETWDRDRRLCDSARELLNILGDRLYEDHNAFRSDLAEAVATSGLALSAAEQKLIARRMSWRVEDAPRVIAKTYDLKKLQAEPLYGQFLMEVDGKHRIVEYEADSELRDGEQIPLTEEGGIEAFFRREVLPYVEEAWIDKTATKVGYELSFARYFYKPQPLRTIEEIRREIDAIEHEAAGALDDILVKADASQ